MSATQLGERLPARLSSASKLQLTGQIIVSYAWVRWAIRRQPLPRVVSLCRADRAGNRRPRLLGGDGYDAGRLGRAVVRTLERLPVDSRCLLSSLVLFRLLAAQGLSPSLVIAVRPGGEVGLDAHAWVELDGRPLLAPAPAGYGRLLTL